MRRLMTMTALGAMALMATDAAAAGGLKDNPVSPDPGQAAAPEAQNNLPTASEAGQGQTESTGTTTAPVPAADTAAPGETPKVETRPKAEAKPKAEKKPKADPAVRATVEALIEGGVASVWCQAGHADHVPGSIVIVQRDLFDVMDAKGHVREATEAEVLAAVEAGKELGFFGG